jgi:hypothetical protein
MSAPWAFPAQAGRRRRFLCQEEGNALRGGIVSFEIEMAEMSIRKWNLFPSSFIKEKEFMN